MTTATFTFGGVEFTEEIVHTDNQAYFDAVAKRILEHPQSTNDIGSNCIYSGEIGCAVGCMVDNDSLKKAMDNYQRITDDDFLSIPDGVAWSNAANGKALASSLQDLHDEYIAFDDEDSRADVITKLSNIANYYGLNFTEAS